MEQSACDLGVILHTASSWGKPDGVVTTFLFHQPHLKGKTTMGAPVVHWEINARDAGRVQEFYAKLFDWKVSADNPLHYGLVNTGSKLGANGGIGQNDPNTPAPSVTFYVQVDDLQKYLDRAESLGGKTIMPPTEIPGMVTMAMFTDPEGNVIGMVKEQAPPATKAPRTKAAVRKSPAKRVVAKKTPAKRKTSPAGKAKPRTRR